MDLAQLRTFVAAADTGSFSGAASAVHASASSVTERIAALENRIDARLFDRSRTGCSLTSAGELFLPRARAMIAMWEISRAEVRVPSEYSAQVRIGGQFSLWPSFLIDWTRHLQVEMPEFAFVLVAGSANRLNSDLGAGLIDLAILYRPVLSPLVQVRRIFTDRLILVRSAELDCWRDGWVELDWGEELRRHITSSINVPTASRMQLDLGGLAVGWLEENCASGYVPECLARHALGRGTLVRVDEAPCFDFPVLATWSQNKSPLIEPLVASLTAFMASLGITRDEGCANIIREA